MAYGRSNGVAWTALAAGAAAAVVGVFLYRRSGRNWNDDLGMAQEWLEGRTSDAQKVLDKTEQASKELLASAQEKGQQALGAAKGAIDGARERVTG